ncbi:RibD family protein [Enterococcus saccharolyticus]|uniref:dihydrofolate reductase family protein n=2 Tax=Enterococcus TaxID=1350 RepID=UPI0022788739
MICVNKPYIFCHMVTSIDGKIDGPHKALPARKASADFFYNVAFGPDAYYDTQAWLSGRTTSDEAFTKYKEPELPENAPIVPEGDFIVETNAPKYYVSVDPSGKLAWESNTLDYRETHATIIEVLTEKASNAYKAMLRERNIPYIICGEDTLDYEAVVEKLYREFNIQTLMLGGGAVLNWSFIQAGLCDEVSVVMAPFADGNAKTSTFFTAKEGVSKDTPVSFELLNVESEPDGTVWLRYKVKKAE